MTKKNSLLSEICLLMNLQNLKDSFKLELNEDFDNIIDMRTEAFQEFNKHVEDHTQDVSNDGTRV